MSTPSSSRAPVGQRHHDLLTSLCGYSDEWADDNPEEREWDAQKLADAEAQAIQKMREWKDSGYKTIEDFRTALKAWGKTQDEMIATVEMLRKYHDEISDINGPLHRAESQLSSLQEQITKDQDALRVSTDANIAASKEIVALQGQLTAKDAEIATLKGELACYGWPEDRPRSHSGPSLQEQLDRAKEDSARLDWLESQEASVHRGNSDYPYRCALHVTNRFPDGINQGQFKHQTVRGVIDAARAPSGQKEGAGA